MVARQDCLRLRKRWASMSAIRLNKVVVSKAAPQGKRYYVKDATQPELYLCVLPSGIKAFELVKKHGGRARRKRLGVFPQVTVEAARAKARELLGELAKGVNVFDGQRLRKAELTLEELFGSYMERHSKLHKKTWKTDQHVYNKHLSGWAAKRLSDLTHDDISAKHAKISAASPTAADRAVTTLRAVYNYAIDELGWGGKNPCLKVRLHPRKERNRFLTEEDLGIFWKAASEYPNDSIRDYLRLSLLMGARKEKMLSMRWRDVHLKQAFWLIEVGKNGESQTVPIAEAALAILKERHARRGDCPWVFQGRGREGRLTSPDNAWRELRAEIGLKDVTLHDLRRTFASWQAMTGSSLPIIGDSLGHKNPSVTAIYARLSKTATRESVSTAVAEMMRHAAPDAGQPTATVEYDESAPDGVG